MKVLVRLFELAVILLIAYPVFYLWDTDRVDRFCAETTPLMSQAELLQRAKQQGMKLRGPEPLAGAQWRIRIESRASFAGYACVIRGAGDTVAHAEIVKGR